jgi:hypothetical protein
MAEINFTLDDFRGMIREEIVSGVTPMIEASELRITKAVAASFAEYEQKYDARFDGVDQRLDKVEHRLVEVEQGLNDVKAEVKGLGRLVGQHSVEIMELKARAA